MKRDVICLGRLALDLVAQQRGARLEDATRFAPQLGGSSGHIAFGCARLGLRAAMLSRVGDDPAGRLLTGTLAAAGCDVSHVAVDPERPTALVLRGIGDPETSPHVGCRESGADLAIQEGDVDEAFLADSRALVITGSQLSTADTHRVSSLALDRARRHGVKTVLDIDDRPALWGLLRPAAGDPRDVERDRVAASLRAMLGRFDLVVGTREAIRIAGGSEDLDAAIAAIRAITPATLVVERGADGCEIVDGAAAIRVPGFAIEARNELGAGGAFVAGLLKGWLTGLGWYDAGRLGNACGALVAARAAGSAAMPGLAELDHFLAHPVASDPHLARLHRVTARSRAWSELYVLAFDHRTELRELARDAGAPEARLAPLRRLLVRAVAETEDALGLRGQVGALIDDTYGEDARRVASERGWWRGRPVAIPGSSPLAFAGGRSIGSRLVAWPRDHAVTCEVRFHPDAPVEDRLEDETQLRALHDAITTSGHELALAVIPPRSLGWDRHTLVRALTRLYNIGVQPAWWTLEAVPAETWRELDALVAARDPACRGALVLGHDASADELRIAFRDAAAARICRGFLVGPMVFREPSLAWLSGRFDDGALVAAVRAGFESVIADWRRARKEAM